MIANKGDQFIQFTSLYLQKWIGRPLQLESDPHAPIAVASSTFISLFHSIISRQTEPFLQDGAGN